MDKKASTRASADPNEKSPWRSTEEVAAHYRIKVNTLHYWRKTNYGPRGTRLGAHLRYHDDEIARFDRELLEASAEPASA